LALAVSLSVSVPQAFASADISLGGASSAVKGSIFTVGIYENSGPEPVNAATATLSYPTNLLTYIGISNSAAFSIVASNGASGGQVSVDRGALPAVAGRQLIASVQFKANTDSGSATISVTGGSVLSANTNGEIFGGGGGLTVALRAPAVAAPEAPAPPADTTPPTISAIKVTAIGTNTATVTWTTSEPATSKVSYGFTNKYGIAADDPALVTSHTATLNPDLLSPMTQVHFLISSSDGAGNTASAKDQTFTTTGLHVLVTVSDKKHKPLAGATLSFAGKSVTTNQRGQATITDLRPGATSGTISYHGASTPATLTVVAVADTQKGVQTISLTGIRPASTTKRVVTVVPFVLIIFALLAWVFARSKIKQLFQKKTVPKADSSNDTVISRDV